MSRSPSKAVYSLLFLTLLFGRLATGASTISLTETQRLKLVKLVASEPDAKKLLRKFQREADASRNEQGAPIVRIGTAGRFASDPLKIQSRASLADMNKLYALGYAYAVTARPAYSAAARRIILHWAKINQPTGVPIDETKLEPLFIAYDLTRSAFSAADKKTVEEWLRTMAIMELQSVKTNSATATNNWNSHRLKIVGLIGFLLADRSLTEAAVEGFKKQIQLNLQPDGSSFDFHERDALRYHCYDLEPLLTLAIAAEQNGIDLYGYEAPTGASLPKSVRFLAPYCEGTKIHLEWVRSKVKFDRQRAEAGEKGFATGTAFDPREARVVFELAAFFDVNYQPLVLRLSEGKTLLYPTWQTVLNTVRAK